MPISVKIITLWRKEVENKPGMMSATLEPLAQAGADLAVVMGYRYPGKEEMAAIELYPIAGKKIAKSAEAAGLSAAAIPTLLVEGNNKPGLAHAICAGLAAEGLNVAFLMAQVIGKKYSAVIGFESEADAKSGAAVIRKLAANKKGKGKKK